MLVEENLLKQAISMFEYRPIIIKPTGGGILRQIKESQPDIKAALAACESTVVPGLLGRERSQEQFIAALACFQKISTLAAKVQTAMILNILGWHDQALMYLNSLSPTTRDDFSSKGKMLQGDKRLSEYTLRTKKNSE